MGISLGKRIAHAARAFVLGDLIVEPHEQYWGHDNDDFSVPEYGNYIATSSIVYSVVSLRADLFADLPLKIYTGVGDAKQQVNRGLSYDLFQKVNPQWTLRRLLKMTAYALDLWGQAFWFVERGESGKMPPQEVWWARPDNVKVIPDPQNYIAAYLYYPSGMGGTPIRFEASEVVWFRNPNPVDQFSPLSPLAAARLAADLQSAAMKSNKQLFDQGLQIGGFIMPPDGSTWTVDQAKQAEEMVTAKHSGVNKAHRWAFFRQQYKIEPSGTTPKDAEFVQTLNLTLEDVARAYRIPLDLLGGQRTYANVEASERGVYQRSIIPLSKDIASEINEQFIPMFGLPEYVEFDTSEIASLQRDENLEWARYAGQLESGAITINEWRKIQGLDMVAWGDIPKWLQTGNALMDTPGDENNDQDNEPQTETQTPPPEPPQPPDTRMMRAARTPYGGDAHRRIFDTFITRGAKHEKKIAAVTAELMRRQKDAVLSGLKRTARSADNPFDMAEWRKKFRVAIRPVLAGIIEEAGQAALDDLKLAVAFKVTNPAVKRFIERRAQRFAEFINETTWEGLRTALGTALDEGLGLLDQMRIVEEYMAERIKSSAETIARTESMGALNGGTLEAWKQNADIIGGKEWIATLDDRVRDTHSDAHGQVVGLDEDFQVGDASGPMPGQMGAAEEDINCRCTAAAVLIEDL